MILVIDNYDSFTYNLVQALQAASTSLRVVRNDELDRADLETLANDRVDPLTGILISPGPGDPDGAGISLDAIRFAVEREMPLLGVCLGMQALAAAFGASVVRAPTLVHGESSQVTHDAKGFLRGMPLPFPGARYHSLCVDASTLPDELYVSALADDGVVMGIRHRTLPIEGVQFHPESVLTPDGPRILARFLRECAEGRPDVLEERRDFCFRGLAA
ncbi:MAG TPA: aminodeoxychorismate/anthranilate synthase component II [Candidatus Limnocylindrales bacterium]|nr:aminodeoxychorismate/anthranilate synthase component II [Candidatus Limnocylindrales bacterium]